MADKEKGISFGPPMVKALLDYLKRQTRRLCKNQINPTIEELPYKVGDTLWVKEALYASPCSMGSNGSKRIVRYGADSAMAGDYETWPWKPEKLAAMYCPKWASRLRLKVTEVRIERLQDITEADAIAEGTDSRRDYEYLWGAINGPKSWAENPWVAVYTFERIQ